LARLDLCSDDEVRDLVHAFYAKVRQDAMLGPIFNGRVHDWDSHLSRLTDFWSAVLRGTGRFTGAPMPRHVALPGLSAELFRRWLALFHESTAAQPNREMGQYADAMARRIAQSLWYGYQMSHRPEALPSDLAHG
jgi:hemoglobin